MGNVYSYTRYDSLGRITEVGQMTGGSAMTDATAKNDASLQSWFTGASSSRNQITQTVYDTAYPAINGVVLSQQNLRNRVSFSQVVNSATDAYPASATYYSYDIHGNVDTLLQDFGNSAGLANIMNQSGNRFKRIQYNYDLISGKANMVTYQRSYFDVTQNAWVTPSDQYYHRYVYDTKNRIKDVYTGRDSVMLYLFPEREAHYYYYTHGSVARTELGQLKVQGLDYAYTIQGWLKGVNPTQGGTLTNGTDTTQPFPVAQNAYGFSLHYYNGDYKAIGYTPQTSSVLGALGASAAPLYNGNIAAMAVNIPQLGSAKVYNYHYDQLNRIVAMDAYNGLNATAGTFTPVSISDYQERTTYDPNGNILTYLRNGDAARLSMDNLSYYYKPRTNQLQKVTDAAADATTNYSLYNDIKQGQLDNNYQYDGIGNLTSDANEGISNIGWSVYGKISSITKTGAAINYTYDATGNRIIKSTASDTTVYVRDGSGNVMSVYVKKVGGSLAQTEMHIYGSSRLGMATQHMVGDTSLVLAGGFGTAIKSTFTRGEKFFELSNHLGNVLATVTDRRMQNSYMGANVDYYTADIAAANDYYPFGMQMPGRKYSSGSQYRYGFNGKEMDNEVKGLGNQQDYGFRAYDPRMGRFLSVDPLTMKYPWYSPYQYAGNKPVWKRDIDGLEEEGEEGREEREEILEEMARNREQRELARALRTPSEKEAARSRRDFEELMRKPANERGREAANRLQRYRDNALSVAQSIFGGGTRLRILDASKPASNAQRMAILGARALVKIETPYGPASQDISKDALEGLKKVNNGDPLYRLGTLGTSAATEGQFWSLESPLSNPQAYAKKVWSSISKCY